MSEQKPEAILTISPQGIKIHTPDGAKLTTNATRTTMRGVDQKASGTGEISHRATESLVQTANTITATSGGRILNESSNLVQTDNSIAADNGGEIINRANNSRENEPRGESSGPKSGNPWLHNPWTVAIGSGLLLLMLGGLYNYYFVGNTNTQSDFPPPQSQPPTTDNRFYNEVSPLSRPSDKSPYLRTILIRNDGNGSAHNVHISIRADKAISSPNSGIPWPEAGIIMTKFIKIEGNHYEAEILEMLPHRFVKVFLESSTPFEVETVKVY